MIFLIILSVCSTVLNNALRNYVGKKFSGTSDAVKNFQLYSFLICLFLALSMVLTSVVQGIDGLHFCGLVGGIQAKNQADDEAEYHRQQHDAAHRNGKADDIALGHIGKDYGMHALGE